MDDLVAQAHQVVVALVAHGQTVAACESLTGGLAAAALTSVPGSSATVRGALVTYATELKTTLAGVDEQLVARDGVVSESVARAMAEGCRVRLGSSIGMSCTGVAGPGPQDGAPAGTVWIAVAGRNGTTARRLSLTGDREAVRRGTVAALFDEVLQLLRGV
ncbi:CinA family protein [Propionibacteriaceae bacterium G1746]|uniref:CinA family protein n=1 Tax=Aestuariimicrobium sp. G57 TaxID=3418485 RepID=UPI003C21F993